jgi:predicted glutamine amidotransferase
VCELLGVSVLPAARLRVYFREFRPRAAENREGWGIAWWEDGVPEIRKEPIPAHESEVAARLAEDPPLGETFIVHVRAATIGHIAVENTHPFEARALGRSWVFAHNGTVQDLGRLDTGAFHPRGETDSERALYHVLTRLEALGERPDDDAIAACVLDSGRELSGHDSRVNFLLSDGRTLFAYHDGHKTLHVIEKRAADLPAIDLADQDYALSLRLGDAPDERAVIVASVPLTDEPGWRRLEAGEFLVIRDGLVQHRVPPGELLGGSASRATS